LKYMKTWLSQWKANATAGTYGYHADVVLTSNGTSPETPVPIPAVTGGKAVNAWFRPFGITN